MSPDASESSSRAAAQPAAVPPAPTARAGWLAPVPLFFVALWSTGFIAAKYGLPYAPPLTFLILRCLGALLVLAPLVFVGGAPWPQGRILHVAVAGLLLQAGYLGGVWSAIKIGMPAGLSALIVGLQPILTAFAAPLVGERVTPRQWLGLLLGLGGVGLVVYAKISLNGLSSAAIGFCVLALLSITSGTLYQKRFCPQFDLRTGTLIQFAATALVLLPLAIHLEDFGPALARVHWTPQFIGALLWSILALSIGAIFLLFRLISRNDATKVTSLLYLTPPTTAVMAWLMFGEALSPLGLVGMVVAVMGVAFVVRKYNQGDCMITTPQQQAVDAAITSRRSIRAYLPTPVAREDIEAILEVAARAPSGTNTQPWKVYVLTGEAKERLGSAILAAYGDAQQVKEHTEEYAYYPREWVSPFIDRRRKVGWDLYALLGLTRENKAGMAAQHGRNYRFFDAPVGLIFTIDRVMEQGSWLDYGMFLQNIMVAARGRGLDTCPQAAFTQFHKIIAEQLGLPGNEMLVCGMALGYADPDKIENSLVTEREPVAGFVRFVD